MCGYSHRVHSFLFAGRDLLQLSLRFLPRLSDLMKPFCLSKDGPLPVPCLFFPCDVSFSRHWHAAPCAKVPCPKKKIGKSCRKKYWWKWSMSTRTAHRGRRKRCRILRKRCRSSSEREQMCGGDCTKVETAEKDKTGLK